MKWITRARPKTDRIACPLADHQVHRPRRRNPLCPRRPGPGHSSTGGRHQLRRPRHPLHPPRRQMHLRGPHRGPPPRQRPGAGTPSQDRARRRHRRRPRHRPGRAGTAGDRRGRAGRRSRRPPAAGKGPLRLRRPLRLVPAPGDRPGMSGTIGYEEPRAATIRQVAQLMAAADQ